MANPEHLELLKQGAAAWNSWRKGTGARPALAGADLRGMNLAGFFLSDAELGGANLSGADLSKASLNRANLEGANLSGAKLFMADLVRATLRRANLSGADFDGATLIQAILIEADLSRARLPTAKLIGARLDGAILAGASLNAATLRDAVLRGADLTGASLINADLSGADLEGVDLRGLNLSGVVLGGLDLGRLSVTEEVRRAEEERRERLRQIKLKEEEEHRERWRRLEEEREEYRKTETEPIMYGSVEGVAEGPTPSGEDVRPPASSSSAVHFTAFHPTGLDPERWHTLLVYAHTESATEEVNADRTRQLSWEPDRHAAARGAATQSIARGAEIVVVPEMPGCDFVPPRARIVWTGDWHRVSFRMRASPELAGTKEEPNGRISFCVGPILVAEVKFWARRTLPVVAAEQAGDPWRKATATPYQAIFISYAHDDAPIVDGLEKAYKLLGFQYLRDVSALRSGERWNEALLRKIDEADIFQLCWSHTARRSPYVEREWRYAFNLPREQFIRPFYWEKPMPEPPPELSDIHFGYFEP